MSIFKKFNRYINIDQAKTSSRKLAYNVRASYSPDLIVCIDNGGLLPGIEIADELNLCLADITVRRNYDLAGVYERAPAFLKPFVEIYQVCLFFTKDPELLRGINIPVSEKKVLLVDDVVHTGKTIQIAKRNILTQFPSDVKTASISYVDGVCPDFFIYQGTFQYPWSRNSPEFEDYKKYLLEKGFSFTR